MRLRRLRHGVILWLVLIAGIATSPNASAADEIKGVITGRANDGTLTMLADDATTMILVMNDVSRVRQVDGVRQLRQGPRTLIPGLRVHVSGTRQGTNQFVVDRITFNRSDMKTALTIRGGVDPTDARSLENQRRIEENARTIAQQQQILARQAEEIALNKEHIAANETRIVATTGELANTNARITNLDNYTTVSTVTVYFRNGKSGIEPQYRTQLQQLAARAKGVPSYVIQIQGYASAVGSTSANQRLSAQRADAVTAELQQSGVPPTSIVVPAAMGITDQVATNKTAKGQAENRRTVVTLLQNKGISEGQ